MKKLENIIEALSQDDYSALEKSLQKNSAEKFLMLLRMYRDRSPVKRMDDVLGVSTGALYALRSRLYDRIQTYLSGDLFSSSEQVLVKLREIPDMCCNKPREISTAFLLKLEEELKQLDMHNELVVVYSALKKMNLFTSSYFHYSQLYNKHIAYNLSVEKSEEILGSFNRLLRQYDFSRDQENLDTLKFLQQEISQHYSLHQSRQIEIMKHIIDVQMAIFCVGNPGSQDATIADKLRRCSNLLDELPDVSPLKPWKQCINYLFFEYFVRSDNHSRAAEYYALILPVRTQLLLSVHVSVSSFLPVSEQLFKANCSSEDVSEDLSYNQLQFDPHDVHAKISIKVAGAIELYCDKKIKDACLLLNQVLNENSLKDFFHISLEIRITLIFMYIRSRDFDMAAGILRNISRKVKTDHPVYKNALHLFNLFSAEIKKKGNLSNADTEQYLLFEARNVGHTQLLRGLKPEMKKIYSP